MVSRDMTESDLKAEILDDQITSLAPPGSGGPPVDRRWRLAAIVAAVAFALSVIVLYPPHSANVASLSATPSASPVTAVVIPTAAPRPTLSPTPDEGPCRTDRIRINPTTAQAVPGSFSPALVPEGALAAFVVDDNGNDGSVMVAGTSGPAGQVVATFITDRTRGNASVNPIGWSSSGTTFLVRADQWGATNDTGCTNLFLVNADGSGVTSLTDLGPGTGINDAALAPNSGLIAYSTSGEVRVIDPAAGERRVADCLGAWQFRWSPDEQQVLGICDVDLLVVDVPGRTAVRATVPDGLAISAATWIDNGASIRVVALDAAGTQGSPLEVLDFSATTLAFTPPVSYSMSASLGFATISPSGRWIVLQDTQDGINTAVLDLATGVTTTLPTPSAAEPGAVPYAWDSDGDTGLYPQNGLLYAVNLATRTLTEVGKMPPSWFVWRSAPAP
jgi:hypothetical protein